MQSMLFDERLQEADMKGSKRRTLFLMLMAYFAGAITMLLFLTPGKVSLNDLLDPEKRVHLADFDRTADKVEELGTWILVRLGRDKQDLQGKSSDH